MLNNLSKKKKNSSHSIDFNESKRKKFLNFKNLKLN
jgi:hypothetical protein